MQAVTLTPGHEYVIEVGRNRSAYKPRYTSTNPAQVAMLYAGINIGNGYKKRLKEDGKVIMRSISQ